MNDKMIDIVAGAIAALLLIVVAVAIIALQLVFASLVAWAIISILAYFGVVIPNPYEISVFWQSILGGAFIILIKSIFSSNTSK